MIDCMEIFLVNFLKSEKKTFKFSLCGNFRSSSEIRLIENILMYININLNNILPGFLQKL